MANNSINGRFRELYKEVEDNLSDESKDLLNALYKRGSKSLHEYRNNLLEILNNEYLKIINELAIEYQIPVEEIEKWASSGKWIDYGLAIERLSESIGVHPTEKECNARYEKIMEPILNVSDEEFEYWQDVRDFVYGVSDDDDDDFISDEDDEYSVEEESRNKYINGIQNILKNRLITIIQSVKNDLKITGQVIDFMLELYDLFEI